MVISAATDYYMHSVIFLSLFFSSLYYVNMRSKKKENKKTHNDLLSLSYEKETTRSINFFIRPLSLFSLRSRQSFPYMSIFPEA